MEFLNLDEFIIKLQELQSQGCGKKELIFDERFGVITAEYSDFHDKIAIS